MLACEFSTELSVLTPAQDSWQSWNWLANGLKLQALNTRLHPGLQRPKGAQRTAFRFSSTSRPAGSDDSRSPVPLRVGLWAWTELSLGSGVPSGHICLPNI